MLKNHMQPIVAYFANAANTNASGNPAARPADSKPEIKKSELKPSVNPMQPIADYYFNQRATLPNQQSDDKQSQAGQQTEWQTNLSRLWHRVMTVDTEPRIRERRDPSGQQYWQVYDPVSQTSQRFFEEAEVYRWLERRYYA